MKKTYLLVLILGTFQLGFGQQNWNVNLLSTWKDTTINPFDTKAYNEVWGFAQNGREYAVMGSFMGTYIIDVTKAEDPTLIQFIPGNFGFASHRDFHDYNGYLYMVADGLEIGLQILDLSYLPDSVSLVYNNLSMIQQCHNIFIDSASARLYACGINTVDTLGNVISSSLGIYSLQDPLNPTLLLDYNLNNMYFHDIYVKDDIAFGHNARDGMYVYDFKDLANPKVINAVIDYPGKGYNHSGWRSEDGDYYYFADETSGSDLKVCDVSDLTDIEVIETVTSRTNDSLIAHNLIVKDNFLFVSHYNDGLRIFSLKDPGKPELAGYYDTYLGTDTIGYFQGAWGVYPFLPSGRVLVSDRGTGLHVFDITGLLTGISEITPAVLTEGVFPNPFREKLTITLEKDQKLKSVRLMDVNGRTVQEFKITENSSSRLEIQIESSLPAGMYFVEINSERRRSTHKLIKM